MCALNMTHGKFIYSPFVLLFKLALHLTTICLLILLLWPLVLYIFGIHLAGTEKAPYSNVKHHNLNQDLHLGPKDP